jgi:hypothetical protein
MANLDKTIDMHIVVARVSRPSQSLTAPAVQPRDLASVWPFATAEHHSTPRPSPRRHHSQTPTPLVHASLIPPTRIPETTMEPKETDVFTYGNYMAAREAQDKAIKREFVKLHDHLESHDLEFAKAGREFAEIRDQLASHDRRFDELSVDIRRNEAISYNERLRKPTLPMQPVPIYRPGCGKVMPDRFPANPHGSRSPGHHTRAGHLPLLEPTDDGHAP